MSIRTELEKKWSDRMESEDKSTQNEIETSHSVVDRLGQEVLNWKEEKW